MLFIKRAGFDRVFILRVRHGASWYADSQTHQHFWFINRVHIKCCWRKPIGFDSLKSHLGQHYRRRSYLTTGGIYRFVNGMSLRQHAGIFALTDHHFCPRAGISHFYADRKQLFKIKKGNSQFGISQPGPFKLSATSSIASRHSAALDVDLVILLTFKLLPRGVKVGITWQGGQVLTFTGQLFIFIVELQCHFCVAL